MLTSQQSKEKRVHEDGYKSFSTLQDLKAGKIMFQQSVVCKTTVWSHSPM